ncbi:sensor histidine kinase [Paenibacillus sp. CAU 1782]
MKWTIQLKMVVLFALITFVGFSAMLVISYRVTEQNMYRIIHDDMIDVKTNLDIAVNQYFLLRQKRINSVSLVSERLGLAKEIGSSIGGSVTIYRPDAKPFTVGDETQQNANAPDLLAAARQEIAYTTHLNNKTAIASLAFPLKSNEATIGILRYQRDYSELYQRNLQLQETLKLFAIAIFVFIFIASVLISRKITNPVRQLTRRSAEVAQGKLDTRIEITTRDEIGELAASFNVMVNRIREQIDVIQQERDEVKQVQARSKTFFDNVTHELKTPLTTIVGYAQLLKDNGFTDKAYFDKGLDYIINESGRLNRMVVDILDYSVASASNYAYRFATVDLASLITESCEDMRIKAEKYNITIHCELEEHLLVRGDREKLKEVFLNVIDNSVKYGHVNSIISIIAKHWQPSVLITIRDRGEGLSEEALQQVFEPFYRVGGSLSREKGSAGLGLSIVKTILEDHGGSIEMSSKLHEGTEVAIRLPKLEETL